MIKTQTMISKDKVKKDKILSEGFKLRKNAQIIFYMMGILGLISLVKGNYVSDIAVLAGALAGWYYSTKFRSWELKNADYIEGLGFTVKR